MAKWATSSPLWWKNPKIPAFIQVITLFAINQILSVTCLELQQQKDKGQELQAVFRSHLQ